MMLRAMGRPLPRIDGRAKVTGTALYAADFNQPGQLHAVVVCADIGLGRIMSLADDSARAVRGVVEVLSHLNAPALAYSPHKGSIDPAIGERLHVLQDDRVRFYGQPVAVVVAETLDDAERGAAALRITYQAEQPLVDPADPARSAIVPEAAARPGAWVRADTGRGDAVGAIASAYAATDETYEIAREHHNPLEPHATIAAWSGDRLTLWSKSQYVGNEQAEIAAIFGVPVGGVQVICPFVGGAFGTSLRTWPHVTLAALAARVVGRPVKLVLSRRQMFFMTGHRPRTWQRIALGATREGKFVSLIHEGVGETSRYEQFIEALTSASDFMYSCANVSTRYRLVPLDISTPTFMRGPGEASGVFALECAIDELSYKVGLDPLELRRRNEPAIDEGQNKPFSSRSLIQCYEVGAKRIDWAARNPSPGSMRDGRLMIGMGVAAANYPAFHAPSSALVRVLSDGTAEVEVATSDMGPGTYTSMTQVAAETLGLPMDRVRFRLGRSDFAPSPSHGGSWTMASVGSAIQTACTELKRRAADLATTTPGSPHLGVGTDGLVWNDDRLARSQDPSAQIAIAELAALAGGRIEVVASSRRDPNVSAQYSMHAFGAVFVQVAVDPDLGMMRVRHAVGVYGAGRIVNPRLASSQCSGGMIGGIGMALMERTVVDHRDGRTVNANFAEYLVPVNLDIGRIDVEFVEENDRHVNSLGVKGLGEIALVGIAPAIANAVFHATGKRVRKLPIRIEDVL